MNIYINIPKEVETALSILNKNGYEAYIVGGCVRDSLLSTVPHDWDITTSAKPNEIINCFKNYRTINTGLKHGTVTVLIDNVQIEVTTYRIDGKYTDNRRPDNVVFTDDIYHDLKRRDFTINALAYNDNGIVDLFDGIEDLQNKVIKCVGNPDERFNEDGLRILRALRFASVLEFSIDDKTSNSIHKNKELLKNISKERINVELNKLINGENFLNILNTYRGVVEVLIPEIKSYTRMEWEHALKSMCFADNQTVKLSLLLLYTNNTAVILKDLKYDNATISTAELLSDNINEMIIADKIKLKKQLNKFGHDNLTLLLNFKTAAALADNIVNEVIIIKNSKKITDEIIENNEAYDLKSLAINGDDLMKEGFRRGKELGSILNDVLNQVIEERLENDRDILINFVKKYKLLNIIE
ncbi:CCA tRNA nucleotidyltransferase [Sedimentibacter sp.]|uniref:CCA tRNA nucleotidyltransferase n=1 Tax=Sedimentibacter sp. TaxID=1960295 RepID=UPI0028AE1538|nr:CCA tRNA nucleotidyltransferase [Sedimentibacter sp.]